MFRGGCVFGTFWRDRTEAIGEEVRNGRSAGSAADTQTAGPSRGLALTNVNRISEQGKRVSWSASEREVASVEQQSVELPVLRQRSIAMGSRAE
ncbi:MAG: hypothetical protein D6725_01445 [Planctomycetota bacterium]|nr:MAG: hypothetical protein D6725_01445 [Planctomycetota bacterium]